MMNKPRRHRDTEKNIMIFRILVIKLFILKSVISREFRQVLAWLNDERTFSLTAVELNRATPEKAWLIRCRSCVMVVYGLKVYFSSLRSLGMTWVLNRGWF